MKQIWKQRKAAKQKDLKAIEGMISTNLEEINETVVEFLDEVTDGEMMLTDLTRLRAIRNELFGVKDGIEEDLEALDKLLNPEE